MARGYQLVYLGLIALVLVMFFTHYGATSSYSYGWSVYSDKTVPAIDGIPLNPDGSSIYLLTTYFLNPPAREFIPSVPNVNLPLHSFATSIFVGITKSYMLSCFLVNLIFLGLLLWVCLRFAEQSGIRPQTLAISGLTLLGLPFFSIYIGQPMHYMVGTVINFFVIFLLLAFIQRKSSLSQQAAALPPLHAGLLFGILALNYDPYVYMGAIIAFIALFARFPRLRDYGVFFLAIATPVVFWQGYVKMNAPVAGVTSINFDSFFKVMINNWLNYFRNPSANPLDPLITIHIGWLLAFTEILSYIYWPILLTVAAGVFFLKGSLLGALKRDKGLYLVLLLPFGFVMEQLFTGAFDFENNARRSIPVLFALGYFYIFQVDAQYNNRRMRYVFQGLLGFSLLCCFADTLTKNPAFQMANIGQAVNKGPKGLRYFSNRLLKPELQKNLPVNEPIKLMQEPREKWQWEHSGKFAFCQTFFFLIFFYLFWLLARARLLPDAVVKGYVGLFFVSLIARFT